MSVALSDQVAEVERRLLALRSQAGAMEGAVDVPHRVSSPGARWAAPRSPGGSPGRNLDPTDPHFLDRLAELKEQHARNLRDLERQLQDNGRGGRARRSVPSSPAPRPQSAGRARPYAVGNADSLAARRAEIDDLLADVRPRRSLDARRLESARRRLHERPSSAPHRRAVSPRVTVARPFDFQSKDDQRRRRKEAELEEQRRRAADESYYRPFKASPVPVSTIEPRYERMVDKAERRREQIRTERRTTLEQTTQPFSFSTRPPVPRRRPRVKTRDEEALEHRFVAKPVPPAVSMRIYEQMQRDDAVRKERVNRAAQEKLAAAALPPRMELYDKMGKVNQVAKKQELSGAAHQPDETFKPKINSMAPGIPPFQTMQAKFAQALSKKKQSVPPTNPEPFSMYTDRRPNRMERVLRDIERDALVLPEQRWPHVSTRAPSKYESVDVGPPPESAYRTTKAAELRRMSLEDEQELKRALAEQKRREDEDRRAKQKRVDQRVAEVLKHTIVTNEEDKQKRRENFIADMREKRENWERVKKDIEDNVSKRPFLFQQVSAAAAADRARQQRLEQFEQTLRENGLGDLIE